MKKFLLSVSFIIFICFTTVFGQKNWTNLFDGTTLTGWKQLTGKATFEVFRGAIMGTAVPNSANSFLATETEYGDFVLEMEVYCSDTAFNSGIQFRSHFDPAGNGGKGKVYGYQYEIDPSSRRWSGGIYDEGRRDWLYPLSQNPKAQGYYRLKEFNKVRIECIGNESRTWINGIPAACLVDMIDYQGFIALQVHAVSKPSLEPYRVFFRNIRIKSLSKFDDLPKGFYVKNEIPNMLTDFEMKSGWKLLFDGENSKGWRGAYKDSFPSKGWEINDGNITVLSSEGHEAANGGDIVTLDQYKTFDLSFDFRITAGANSGVKYFVTLKEKNEGSAIGLEYQILDDSLHPDAKLGRDGDRTMASLYDLIPAVKQARFIHPVGKWNTGRIIVYPNNHVEHYLNGIKVLEYERGSPAFRALVAVSKYKVWPNFGEAPEGHILLQDHGNEVSFRSIKIRVLE
ncbi:MAG TPA: DUF1080 domain-containing protein [Puia sp.]|nr:DUF1080 domain-containing protein [Puia sp.]